MPAAVDGEIIASVSGIATCAASGSRLMSGDPDAVPALEVDREADQIPLAARLGLAAETEAAEAEDFFDPADDGLDNRFAATVARTSHITLESVGHALGRTCAGFGGLAARVHAPAKCSP